MRRLAPVRWLREHPFAADALLGLGLFAVALPGLWVRDRSINIDYRDADVLGVALLALSTLPLAWRRRNSMAVLWVVGVGAVLFEARGYSSGAGGVGVLVALYTVAAHCDRRRAVTALVATAAALTVVFLTARWEVTIASIGGNVVIFITSWILGDNLQTRRRYVLSVEERAERLEREREEVARRAVEDERSRIARELHDVVAHNVSVMVVQAGAARRVLDRKPDQAAEAISAIETTGRQALDELRRLLGVLRRDDDASDRKAPQPSVLHVDALVDQMRDAGLDVTLEIEGQPGELPAAIDLSAYRIVQEALTNVVKHAGPARAWVRVRYDDDALGLEVVDDGRGLAEQLATGNGGGGHGLVGMRERVALFGGTLRAGPRTGGGYRVQARIPLSEARVG